MDLECLCQKDKLTLHPNPHILKQQRRNVYLNLPPTKVIFRCFFFPKLKNNHRKPPKSFNLILAIFSPSMPEGYKIIYNRKPLISELLCFLGFFQRSNTQNTELSGFFRQKANCKVHPGLILPLLPAAGVTWSRMRSMRRGWMIPASGEQHPRPCLQ